MAERTEISWADATFNPWLGCTEVSNGPKGACAHCYARVLVQDRFGRAEWGGPGKGVGTRVRTSPANWRKPIAWDRGAAAAGTRPFVFCSSLADVFDNEADPEWRRDLFDLIRETPYLVWLLLTKRPQNIARLFSQTITPELRAANRAPALLGRSLWPKNAAIGFTAVTQEEFDRDWPKARDAFVGLQAPMVFWSGEPMMSRVALPSDFLALGRQAWAITGGETDQGAHKARPSNPAWFRSIRDQCSAAGVAYHHKQNGEFAPADEIKLTRAILHDPVEAYCFRDTPDDAGVVRVGKRRAGRELDGVVHDARPEVAG